MEDKKTKKKFTIEDFDARLDEIRAKHRGGRTEGLKAQNPMLARLQSQIKKGRGKGTEALNLEDLMRQ